MRKRSLLYKTCRIKRIDMEKKNRHLELEKKPIDFDVFFFLFDSFRSTASLFFLFLFHQISDFIARLSAAFENSCELNLLLWFCFDR